MPQVSNIQTFLSIHVVDLLPNRRTGLVCFRFESYDMNRSIFGVLALRMRPYGLDPISPPATLEVAEFGELGIEKEP